MLQKIGKAKKKRKTKHLCSWGDIFLSSKNVVRTLVMQGSSNRCCHDGNSPVVLLLCNAMAFPSYPVPVCRHRARTGNLSLALAHPENSLVCYIVRTASVPHSSRCQWRTPTGQQKLPSWWLLACCTQNVCRWDTSAIIVHAGGLGAVIIPTLGTESLCGCQGFQQGSLLLRNSYLPGSSSVYDLSSVQIKCACMITVKRHIDIRKLFFLREWLSYQIVGRHFTVSYLSSSFFT